MDIYGLLGYPLGHSFSASYFRQKFEREHLHADYLNFEYPEVCEALSYMLTLHNLKGFNVTIPHKKDIIPRLSSLSAEAEAIGAVNVVKVRQDEEGHIFLDGYNSDLIGFRESIRPLLDQGLHRSALVLGTGGASRAVCYGLHQLGLTTLSVSRSPKPGCITYEQLTPEIMRTHLVVVNTTPVGMFPHTDEAPAIPYESLTKAHVLFDLVYNPMVTRFMQLGLEQGAKVKNGLEMLHRQADEAWRIWQEV